MALSGGVIAQIYLRHVRCPSCAELMPVRLRRCDGTVSLECDVCGRAHIRAMAEVDFCDRQATDRSACAGTDAALVKLGLGSQLAAAQVGRVSSSGWIDRLMLRKRERLVNS